MNSAPNHSAKNILVLDDEPQLRLIIEMILLRAHYQPYLAATVEEAEQLVLQHKIDLVLCDMNMPGRNGLDFLRWLETHRPLPVLVMTGSALLEEMEEAAHYCPIGILAKPFEREELLKRVSEGLKLSVPTIASA